MKQALESNICRWSYVKGILQEWNKKGLTTIEEVENDKQTFKLAKQQKGRAKNHKQEVIPGWFENRNEKKKHFKKYIIQQTIVGMQLHCWLTM